MNPNADEFDSLLAQGVEGTLSDDELRRLEQLLAADSTAQHRYVDHLLLEHLLGEELGAEAVTGLVDLFGPEAQPTPVGIPQRRSWNRGLALAAAVLLAVGALTLGYSLVAARWPRPEAATPSQTRVVECNGLLELMNPEGEAETAGMGQTVRSGQSLRTAGENSFAVVTRDDLRLELTADTTVRLLDEDTPNRGRRFHLSQGVMRVEAAAAANGRPMMVSTPQASIVATSATFICSTTGEATYVEVEEGTVQLVREADGAPVEVGDGFTAVASADVGEHLIARRVPSPSLRPPTALKAPGVNRLVFGSDNASLIGLVGGRAVGWDMTTGLKKPDLDAAVLDWKAADLSADGRLTAGYGKKHAVKVVETSGAKELLALTVGTRNLSALVLAGAGSRLAVVEQSEKNRQTVHVWEVATGTEQPVLRLSGRLARVLALSPDGALVAVGNEEGDVVLANAGTAQELARFRLPGAVRVLAFAPDGQRLVGAGAAGTLILWDVATRTERWRVQAPGRPFAAVAFSPGGQLLAAGTADGTTTLWQADAGAEQLSLKGTHPGMAGLSFSPNGAKLAVAVKRVILLWQLPVGLIDPHHP